MEYIQSIEDTYKPIINSKYPDYLYYGQFERNGELDKRIYERNMMTDIKLRPNFEPRSVNTRQVIFPIVTTPTNVGKESHKIPINKYLEYNPNKVFSSIQSNGPIKGYLDNIMVESSLRNQYFGIKHGAIQSTYIPSSKSDLYVVEIPQSTERREEQPFPLLFEKSTYKTSGSILDIQIGKDIFNNATKQQLRNLS